MHGGEGLDREPGGRSVGLEVGPGTPAPSGGRWTAAALLVFTLASLFLFRSLLGEDPTRVVPVSFARPAAERVGTEDWSPLIVMDQRFMVWLVARNAHTLTHRPLSLFEAEQCYPARKSLALGETGIALGLLGVPFQLLGGDPLLTFNGVLLCIALIAAFAMFFVVRDWTGDAAAGVVAGLLFSFHTLKLGDIVHVAVWDDAWTLLAFFFSVRLFARRRWTDAVALAGCLGMQLAGSIYPLLAAAVLALPFLIWLLVRGLRERGWRGLPLLQIAFVASVAAFVAWLVISPYFDKTEAGEVAQVAFQGFRPLGYAGPSGLGFSGWVIWGLVIAAFALPRRRTLAPALGDPRWALVAGGLLVFAFAVVAGGEPGQATVGVVPGEPPPGGFPNLYLLLSSFVPGLASGRGPGSMYSGVHLVLCLLAGLGAAGLRRSLPARLQPYAAGLLLALAALDTLRPAFLGLEQRIHYELRPLRPTADELALFAALEQAGDAGPLLEVPVNLENNEKASRGVLLSAYHHRPTSYCYNSFVPPVSRQVEAMAARLPERGALIALRQIGFTTVVVHHAQGELAGEYHRRLFEGAAVTASADLLEKLYANESVTAWRLRR